MSEVTPEVIEEMLLPRVEIDGIASEKNIEKVNEIAFELYKEAASVVNFVAHLAPEEGGWPRNQAICGGLMIRIFKLMLVVTQLSAKRDRGEVVYLLNRSIMESAVNLEFLVRKNDDKIFDQFVSYSLGPERELYDLIQEKIKERGGKVEPIERSMLASIDRTCRASRVRIEDVKRKYGEWGGGIRERLKALDKEERYVAVQRVPSHAVHGTWVDVYQNHLEHDAETDQFRANNGFVAVDARFLGPVGVIALEATRPYVERFFSQIPESETLVEGIDDLTRRIRETDAVHERLMGDDR
jgi:hypothetical protein